MERNPSDANPGPERRGSQAGPARASIDAELAATRQEAATYEQERNALAAALRSRNAEFDELNDDLCALLSAGDRAVVLVDAGARVRRFSPKAGRLLGLSAAEVGQPVASLKPPFNLPGLDGTVREVLESGTPQPRQFRDGQGRRHSLRILPFIESARRSAIAVLEFVEPAELKHEGADIGESGRYAKAIVESVRHPIVLLDRNFLARDANRAFYEVFGLSAAEVLGHSMRRPRTPKLAIPGVQELLDRLRAGEPHVDGLEIEYRAGAGARYLLLDGRKLRTGDGRVRFLLSFHDITGQRVAAEARYRRLFETARDGIAIVDAETMRVVDINPALEKLTGFTREESLGRTPWEIRTGSGAAETQANLERIREQGTTLVPAEMLHTMHTKDGRQVPIEVRASPYREGGRTFIQLNVRDITERKKFEVDLLHTQKLESLGQLAGGVAHDFNNLLTGILGNASLAYGHVPIDSPLRPQLREIMRAAERAAFLTRQMLAYAGKGTFVVERLEIGDLIREMSALIRTSIPRTVEVVFDVAAGLPPVEADRGQIQQLMMNLVVNGAEAIGENRAGRIDIRATLEELPEEPACPGFPGGRTAPGTYVRIAVIDDGSGMDEETRTRAFDPFFTTKFTGRGLGLAAVMGIVKGHRGAIRVDSVPGRGTTFEVLLPTADQPPREEAVVAARSAPPDATVLVIDDEEIVRNVAAAALDRVGYHVLTAANGREGVGIFEKRHKAISLVLLDLLMPEMGGEEALERLQAIDPGVPVVLSSGFDQSEAARRLKGKRPAGFIQKPYDLGRLVESISMAIPRLSAK